MTTIPNRSEAKRACVTFALFFIVCFVGLIDVSPFVMELSAEGVKVPYPLYEHSTNLGSFDPVKIYKRSLNPWLQDLGDLIGLSLLPWLLVIRPNMKHWGFDLSYMWIFYFQLLAIDRLLFHGRLPYGYYMEVFVLSIQVAYTISVVLSYKRKQQRQ